MNLPKGEVATHIEEVAPEGEELKNGSPFPRLQGGISSRRGKGISSGRKSSGRVEGRLRKEGGKCAPNPKPPPVLEVEREKR